MFPDQNVHYIKNFNIGYQGVNYIKSTEYNNKFKYDQGKAIIALESSSPKHKKRMSTLQNPNGYDFPPSKAETVPAYTASLPSQDNRGRPYYPESIPPLDEDPPSASLPMKMDPQLLIRDQAAEQPMEYPPDVPQDYSAPSQPLEVPEENHYQSATVDIPPLSIPQAGKEIEDQWSKLVKHQSRAAETDRTNIDSQKRVNTINYKEELDRQIQYKSQKKGVAQTLKAQELQSAKDWQQEMTRQDKTKQDETKRLQELTKQFYDKQISEKESRSFKTHSRSSVPPPPIARNEVVEEQQFMAPPQVEVAKKPVEDMDNRAEKFRPRQKLEIQTKSVLEPSISPLNSMPFDQDINRQRYKQVQPLSHNKFLNRNLTMLIKDKKLYIKII